MDKQNTTPPDMIAQAGELLKRIQNGHRIGVDWSDDKTIVIASAVLAVAGEIRELRNVLADGLLSQLAELDADNALLIDRLRSMNQALEGDNAALTDRLRRSAAHDGEAIL